MPQPERFDLPVTVVRDDDGCTWRPWTDGWAVGFQVTNPAGEVRYSYLNPSGGSDDGVPTVFMYSGPSGEPGEDSPIVVDAPFD